MVEGVAGGKADGILVWKYSRWGRNLNDSLTNIRALQDAGGFIISSTEPGDVETPHGKFSLHMLLVIAELQSDQIKESWRDSQWNRISQGLPGNGKPRFGYDYDREKREFNKNSVTNPWLRRAYVGYITGAEPLSRVVLEMTRQGIRGTEGKPLTHTSMLFILDSGFGAGKIIVGARRGKKQEYDPTYYPGKHEACISEEEWQAYLRKRKSLSAPRIVNPASKLSGIARCGNCGRTLARFNDAQAKQLGCRNTPYNSGNPCLDRCSIREHKVEQAVYEWLLDQADAQGYDEAAAKAAAAEDARGNLAQLQQEAIALEEAILRVEDRLARGKIDEGPADTLKAEYQAELRENRENQAEMEKASVAPIVPTPEMFTTLAKLWMDPTIEPSVVNAALAQVVKAVKVYPKTADVRVRVIPVWGSDGDSRQDEAA
jgi:site-specific DNA recombinase